MVIDRDKLSAIILSGGKSSRMGQDKGLLEMKGKRMIDFIIAAVKPMVSEIIIVANNDDYSNFGYKVVKDLVKDKGPIGGIYTGLKNSNTEINLVLSCDMPFVKTYTLEFLVKNYLGGDVAVAEVNNQMHPLLAIYRKSCCVKLFEFIKDDKLRLRSVVEKMHAQQIRFNLETSIDEIQFININSPVELSKAVNYEC